MQKQGMFSEQDVLKIYQSIWENSPEAFVLIDIKGNIILYNTTLLKIFDLPENTNPEGKSAFNFIDSKDREKAIKDMRYAIANNVLQDCEYLAVRNGGVVFPIMVSYSVIQTPSSTGPYVLLAIKDITKLKIEQRAVRNAKEKAEIADKIKTSFLANMSHEIRTPINAIIGFADLLNDEDLMLDEKEEYIKTIQVNGELLLKLINDIIDIAKIESGQLKIMKSNFSIDELFEETYRTAQNNLNLLQKNHLTIDYDIDEKLKGKTINSDQYRLMQIINNLLSNAIKFTDDGIIEYGIFENANNKLEFFVKDTGIGIPEKDQLFIFDRFGQVEESLARNVSGTGLGLSITKSLVEILGGRIQVKSTLGEGSTFKFTIDVPFGENQLHHDEITHIDLHNKKILIVEDTESNYRLLQIMLEKNGAETIWALKGEQSVSICKNTNDIDLVLMDINLPDIDGYEATSRIKAIKPNLPIVAQTAYAMAGEREKSIEFGCDEYVSKPINQNQLFGIIAHLIG